MIGIFQIDVFAEAGSTDTGSVSVNFVTGEVSGGSAVSDSMRRAALLYSEALPALCEKHQVNFREVKVLEARYGTDRVYGRHFTVTVEATDGKRSTVQYVGVPGRRATTRRK
jgi:hypothetical protein